MLLPAVFHRNWNIVEPSLLGGVSLGGGTMSVLLAQSVASPAEAGGVFVTFLISLGLGVLGIAGFTASYVAKAIVKGFADIGGSQARKLYALPEPEALERRLADMTDQSVERAKGITEVLADLKESVNECVTTSKLLNQSLEQQIKRTDEQHADISRLQSAVFNRRGTDQT